MNENAQKSAPIYIKKKLLYMTLQNHNHLKKTNIKRKTTNQQSQIVEETQMI